MSASVLPAILGAVWCWTYGDEFHLIHVLLGAFGVFFLHLGANTLNDYYDWDMSDRINRFPTPFSGGSRSRLENILTRKTFLYMSIIFLIIFLCIAIVPFFIILNRNVCRECKIKLLGICPFQKK